MAAINPPKEVSGFGKLGKFCRDILSYARSIRIESIEIQEETNRGVPPKAQIRSSPTGTHIILRVGKGGGGTGSLDVADSDGGEVDNIGLLRFENTDPEAITHLTAFDNGGGEAIIKFPTGEYHVVRDGVLKTRVFVVDGPEQAV